MCSPTLPSRCDSAARCVTPCGACRSPARADLAPSCRRRATSPRRRASFAHCAPAAAGAGWEEPARGGVGHAVARGDMGGPAAAGGGGRAEAADAVDAAAGARRPERGAVPVADVPDRHVPDQHVAHGHVPDRGAPPPGHTGVRQRPPSGERAREIAYAPDPDGAADPGEIVWTWVPFEEDASQGKDRPLLVVGRAAGAPRADAVQPVAPRRRRELGLDRSGGRGTGRAALLHPARPHSGGRGARHPPRGRDPGPRRFEVVAQRLRGEYGWR